MSDFIRDNGLRLIAAVQAFTDAGAEDREATRDALIRAGEGYAYNCKYVPNLPPFCSATGPSIDKSVKELADAPISASPVNILRRKVLAQKVVLLTQSVMIVGVTNIIEDEEALAAIGVK